MSAVEFFADVVTTGEVLGVDGWLTPEIVTEVFGVAGAENTRPGSLDRDYGLVEFSWTRFADGPWCGLGFSVRADPIVANAAIEARYGPVRVAPRLAELRRELGRRGVALTDEHWQPESEVIVYVRDGMVTGLNHPSLPLSHTGLPGLSKSLPQTLKHLLPLSEVDRRRWAERKQPDPRWWESAASWSRHRVYAPERPEDHEAWLGLTRWLSGYGREIGAVSVAEAALASAILSADLLQQRRFEHLLPTADEVIRDCLDALPEDLREARAAGRPAMMAKRLVDVAMRFEDRVRDPEPAARLREVFATRWG